MVDDVIKWRPSGVDANPPQESAKIRGAETKVNHGQRGQLSHALGTEGLAVATRAEQSGHDAGVEKERRRGQKPRGIRAFSHEKQIPGEVVALKAMTRVGRAIDARSVDHRYIGRIQIHFGVVVVIVQETKTDRYNESASSSE